MLGRILRGRYQIVEQLREGRFYITYVARIAGTDNRCIVKVIRDEFTFPDTMERLKPDLGVVAALKNERIALLKDFGEFQGRIFLVEEDYEGIPLEEVLEPGRRFGVLRALELGIRIADAVAFAHAKGVYHGFLTPSSVVVLSDLEVKVGDFYLISSMLDPEKAGGVYRECEDFIAPESRRGEKATFVSDVYSLGAILHVLLTGVVPQRKPTLGDIADRQGGEPVSPRELNESIPSLLDAAIKRALRWDAAGRYGTVREMISELLLCRSTLLRAGAREAAPDSVSPTQREAREPAPAQERKVDPAVGMRHDTGIVVSRREGDAAPEEDMAARRKKEARRRYVPVVVLLGVLLAIIVFIVGMISSLGWLRSPIEFTVPDVVGKYKVEAISTLGAKGFSPEVTAEQSSDMYPEGYIVKQYPAAGMKVKEGRRVELVVSSGHKRVTVPSLEGRSLKDAEVVIDNARLEAGEISKVFSDEHSEGYVVEQHPSPGKEVLAGSEVQLVVSKGLEPTKVLMPVVVKLNVDRAIELLNSKRIRKIQIVDVETRAGPPGTVVSQSVLGDTSVDRTRPVSLYIAVEPESGEVKDTEGAVNFKMGAEKDEYRVVIRLIDGISAKDVYHQEHGAGESISVPVTGMGGTVVHVFIDGFLVTEKTLKGVSP